MTKQQRKEIYWAAMFEIAAFGGVVWLTLDYLCERLVSDSMFPELTNQPYYPNPLHRFSNAIDLCEQYK